MSRFLVRQISAEETIELRWPILRSGLPRESAVFEGDDRPDTCHFGAFSGPSLMGVATVLRAPLPEQPERLPAMQLRGMAVREEARGLGCGSALVRTCELEARLHEMNMLWCNARSPAVEFYRRHGFETLGGEFEIPTAGPHWRMLLEI